MKFTITLTINKSTPEVFRYLTSSAKLGEWMRDFQSIKSIKGRRSKVGGKSKLMMRDTRSSFSIEEEILEFDRNKRFKVQLDHSEMMTAIDYQFGDNGDTTILIAKYHIGFKNVLNSFFGLFFKIPMRNQQREDLQKLKRKVEKL